MTNVCRGEIYYIKFPYTFDEKYPKGKSKFVLVLQEGEYFTNYDTIAVLLIASDGDPDLFPTDVEIPKGTTRLNHTSYIQCAQSYTIRKILFDHADVWCAGKLSSEKMDEVDSALFIGLCMDKQNDIEAYEQEEQTI